MANRHVRSNRKTILVSLSVAAAALVTAACVAFRTTETGNAGSGPVDVLVVFGSPTELSGDPSPMQSWRVREAVAEYRKRQAPFLLFTGGSTDKHFVEADVMARLAVQMGVPPAAIWRETRSTTTMENIRNVTPMLRAHGWTRAEMVSSADHLPRIAVLLGRAPFQWRLRSAPTAGRGFVRSALSTAEEALAVLILRSLGTRAESIIHDIAVGQHHMMFAFRSAFYTLRSSLSR